MNEKGFPSALAFFAVTVAVLLLALPIARPRVGIAYVVIGAIVGVAGSGPIKLSTGVHQNYQETIWSHILPQDRATSMVRTNRLRRFS